MQYGNNDSNCHVLVGHWQLWPPGAGLRNENGPQTDALKVYMHSRFDQLVPYRYSVTRTMHGYSTSPNHNVRKAMVCEELRCQHAAEESCGSMLVSETSLRQIPFTFCTSQLNFHGTRGTYLFSHSLLSLQLPRTSTYISKWVD